VAFSYLKKIINLSNKSKTCQDNKQFWRQWIMSTNDYNDVRIPVIIVLVIFCISHEWLQTNHHIRFKQRLFREEIASTGMSVIFFLKPIPFWNTLHVYTPDTLSHMGGGLEAHHEQIKMWNRGYKVERPWSPQRHYFQHHVLSPYSFSSLLHTCDFVL